MKTPPSSPSSPRLAAETKRTSYPLVNTCDEQDGREARRYRRALRRALAEDRLPSAAETVELLNTREVRGNEVQQPKA